MNLVETYVSNITKIELGLPNGCIRITADFEDERGIEIQATKVVSLLQYTMSRANGYYWSKNVGK